MPPPIFGTMKRAQSRVFEDTQEQPMPCRRMRLDPAVFGVQTSEDIADPENTEADTDSMGGNIASQPDEMDVSEADKKQGASPSLEPLSDSVDDENADDEACALLGATIEKHYQQHLDKLIKDDADVGEPAHQQVEDKENVAGGRRSWKSTMLELREEELAKDKRIEELTKDK